MRSIEDYKNGNMQERERTRKKIAFFGHFDSSNFGNAATRVMPPIPAFPGGGVLC